VLLCYVVFLTAFVVGQHPLGSMPTESHATAAPVTAAGAGLSDALWVLARVTDQGRGMLQAQAAGAPLPAPLTPAEVVAPIIAAAVDDERARAAAMRALSVAKAEGEAAAKAKAAAAAAAAEASGEAEAPVPDTMAANESAAKVLSNLNVDMSDAVVVRNVQEGEEREDGDGRIDDEEEGVEEDDDGTLRAELLRQRKEKAKAAQEANDIGSVRARAGYMLKKGAGSTGFGRRNWKRRYFELNVDAPHQPHLRYWENEQHFKDGGTRLGEVNLHLCQHAMGCVGPTAVLEHKHDYFFQLQEASGRCWAFRAESDESRDSWVEAIQAALASMEHGQDAHAHVF